MTRSGANTRQRTSASTAPLGLEVGQRGAEVQDPAADEAGQHRTVSDREGEERVRRVGEKAEAPTRSGWVGTSASGSRETCQRKRALMKTRKYQRRSRNCKTGRLTKVNHAPAGENLSPLTRGTVCDVALSCTP